MDCFPSQIFVGFVTMTRVFESPKAELKETLTEIVRTDSVNSPQLLTWCWLAGYESFLLCCLTYTLMSYIELIQAGATNPFVQYVRFTSTETIRTIRDGDPRTSTSSFTQLLNWIHFNWRLYLPRLPVLLLGQRPGTQRLWLRFTYQGKTLFFLNSCPRQLLPLFTEAKSSIRRRGDRKISRDAHTSLRSLYLQKGFIRCEWCKHGFISPKREWWHWQSKVKFST